MAKMSLIINSKTMWRKV